MDSKPKTPTTSSTAEPHQRRAVADRLAPKEIKSEPIEDVPTYVLECPKHGKTVFTLVDGRKPEDCTCPHCAREAAEAEAKQRAALDEHLDLFKRRASGLDDFVGDVISPLDPDASFSGYELDQTCADQVKAVKVCKLFAQNFRKRLLTKPKAEAALGLLLHGDFGCGKTHLASAIVNHLKRQGYRPFFVTANTFFSLYRSSSGLSPVVLARKLSWQALLVIDEIGRSAASEYERTVLSELLDERVRLGLPTVLITNLTGKAYAELMGGAFVSRTSASLYPVRFSWKDYRKVRQAKDLTPEEAFGC